MILKRNFQFDGFSVVRCGDRFLDLHNAYDLECFGTDLAESEVKLGFSRNEFAIDPDELPSQVAFSCTGNVRVVFNDLGKISAPLDDEGTEVAFFDEACDWFSFLNEDIARLQEPLGLHVSFTNGLTVRIFCDEILLTTQSLSDVCNRALAALQKFRAEAAENAERNRKYLCVLCGLCANLKAV